MVPSLTSAKYCLITFSQFGDVSKLRLSRNKKTGRSRHYAFIEFADRHVAAVVAETMDGYLLCNKLLVC